MKPGAVVTLSVLCLLAACGDRPQPAYVAAPWSGDVENGRLLLRQFGCGGCHIIPGVSAARGRVGPPLAQLGRRAYIAGVLPNTPQQLSNWIVDPQAFQPGTAMPDMGVSPAHARDIVAYLLTLQ